MELRKYQKEFRMRLVKEKQNEPRTKEYFVELINDVIKDAKDKDFIHFYMFCHEYRQLEKIWNDIPEFVNNEYFLEAETNTALCSSPPQFNVYLRKSNV